MPEPQSTVPKVVLLAEDDEVNQEIVRHILLSMPEVELVIANDGREALQYALARRFDLMIFDRNMPHIPGDRIIRHLKAAKTINDGTPIIQFSAAVDRVTVNSGVNAFADATLPKPVQAADLLSLVARLLES